MPSSLNNVVRRWKWKDEMVTTKKTFNGLFFIKKSLWKNCVKSFAPLGLSISHLDMNQHMLATFTLKVLLCTHLSIDIATKLNIDDVEQITSIAI